MKKLIISFFAGAFVALLFAALPFMSAISHNPQGEFCTRLAHKTKNPNIIKKASHYCVMEWFSFEKKTIPSDGMPSGYVYIPIVGEDVDKWNFFSNGDPCTLTKDAHMLLLLAGGIPFIVTFFIIYFFQKSATKKGH